MRDVDGDYKSEANVFIAVVYIDNPDVDNFVGTPNECREFFRQYGKRGYRTREVRSIGPYHLRLGDFVVL